MSIRIDKLAVVGVGLIGGSFALALRSAGVVRRVVGIGRTGATIRRALELGIIDEASTAPEAVAGASLVLLAMPVGQSRAVFESVARHLSAGAVLTDAGSTKCNVVQAAREVLPAPALERFVPGHPIAGTEHSGPAAAFADLYRGRKVVLTPLAQTDPAALALVRAAWEACGARIFELSAEAHDDVFAAVSHLPHLLAYALVDQVASHPDGERLFSFAAGGFRDFTRIASSHPEMWRDICMANRGALLARIEGFERALGVLRAALDKSDGAALEAVFQRARAARNRWLEEAHGDAPANGRDLSS